MSLVSDMVARERAHGASWSAIGAIMGVDRSVARQRFGVAGRGERIEAALSEYEAEAKDLVALIIDQEPLPQAALLAYAAVFVRHVALGGADLALAATDRAAARVQKQLALPAPRPPAADPYAVVAVLSEVMARVCAGDGVAEADLVGPSRRPCFAIPRQRFMAEAWATGEVSLNQIGRRLGGRDHTTIIHGLRRHWARLGLPVPPRAMPVAAP